MKIIKASYEISMPVSGEEMLKQIERAARTCYKSEEKIAEGSTAKMVKMLIDRGHEAMLEHASFTVRFICDRGVSHELVRHRIASFAQESTRYCNYSDEKFGKEITVIKPCFLDEYKDRKKWLAWSNTCAWSEWGYFRLLEAGATPQEARAVLPNSLKTEVVMTANLREWRHFFKLRTAAAAHPQMRELTIPLLAEVKTLISVIFDDIV